MNMFRKTILITLTLILFSPPIESFSRGGGGGVHRIQATAIQRAVGKRARKLFRPNLVIARNSIGSLTAVALDSQEQLLAVAASKKQIRVWNLSAGREQATLHTNETYQKLIFSDQARYLAGYSSKSVSCWDMKSAQLLQSTTPSDDILAAFFYKQALVVCDKSGGLTSISLNNDLKNHRVQLPVQPVAAVSLSGGEQIALLTAKGWLYLFDMPTEEIVAQKEISAFQPDKLAATPAGKTIVAFNAKGRISVWDTTKNDIVRLQQLKDRPVRLLAGHTDGSLLTVDKKGKIIFWDASRSWKKRIFKNSIKDVKAVVLGNQAEFAVFTTATGFVELWSLKTGRRQIQLASTTSGWAAVAEDGRFDGDVQALNDIEWRDKKVAASINSFSENYFSPGLLARAIRLDPKKNSVKNVREGVLMPPQASLKVVSQAGGQARIKVMASEQGGGGLGEVRLYLNGRLITSSPENEQIKPASLTRSYAIKLVPGNNVVEASAFNSDKIEGVSERLLLTGPGVRKPGRLHLIVIGLNRYANSELNLNYAVSDADAVVATLQTSPGPFSGINLRYLRNEEATKSGILAAMRYLQGMPREDMAFIYYAGHGVADKDEWYLVAHEVTNFDKDSGWKEQAISSTELRQLIEGAGPDKIFMAIDACQSGQSVDVLSQFKGIRSLRLLARTVGVHILAATTSQQLATELDTLGHGVFTYSLLRALHGSSDIEPADGHVSAMEIMRYVEKEVPILSRNYTAQEQYPTLHSRGNDYDLLYMAP